MTNRVRQWWNRNEPVYVVAGFQRSGTTMMMQALEAGGLSVDRARKGDARRGDYELGGEAYMSIAADAVTGLDSPATRFPRAHRGRLIKALVGSVHLFYPQPAGIVTVWMNRPWAEISDSYEALNGIRPREDWAWRNIKKELARWDAREDVRLVGLDFAAVVAEPLKAMERLREHGFPINPRKAAAIVDADRPQHFLHAAESLA